jgi:mannose-6-phosphate isomerase-like protein (cupin superfamily)
MGDQETPYKFWESYEDIPEFGGALVLDDQRTEKWARRHAIEEFESEHIKFNIWHIEPGQSSVLNAHEEPVREFYYIIDGTLDIRLVDANHDEVVQADAGSVIYIPADVKHRPKNTSDEPAVLLAVSGPPVTGDRITVYEDEEQL